MPPRRLLMAFLAALTGTTLTLGDESAASAATLHVRITGFKTSEGELAIALFDSAGDYRTQSNAVRRAYLPVENLASEWRVEDLPAGEYAVIAYHDENGNREIDFRLLGMPKEPVAVSNDARGVFGPPKFDAAKFEVRPPVTRIAIRLE
jgi:uncharacterized protein (DUF2141 family)